MRGHSAKVITDMFGLSAPTSYRRKVARIAQSIPHTTPTLREQLLAFIAITPVSRAEILARFATRDEGTVLGLLRDLLDVGIVGCTAHAPPNYHVAFDDLAQGQMSMPPEALAELVSVIVCHRGPLSLAELERKLGPQNHDVAPLVQELLVQERLHRDTDGRLYGDSIAFDLFEASDGDQALSAIVDHHHAAVATIVEVARKWAERPTADTGVRAPPAVMTVTYETWPGHPLHRELSNIYPEMVDRLRAAFVDHSDATPQDAPNTEHREQLTIYCGAVSRPVSGRDIGDK